MASEVTRTVGATSGNEQAQVRAVPYRPCHILLALAAVGLGATLVTMGLGLKKKMSMVPAYMSASVTAIFTLMAVSFSGGVRHRSSGAPQTPVARSVADRARDGSLLESNKDKPAAALEVTGSDSEPFETKGVAVSPRASAASESGAGSLQTVPLSSSVAAGSEGSSI
jgi:hypothetical protein